MEKKEKRKEQEDERKKKKSSGPSGKGTRCIATIYWSNGLWFQSHHQMMKAASSCYSESETK
jgi:hypothetical protein